MCVYTGSLYSQKMVKTIFHRYLYMYLQEEKNIFVEHN